MHTGRDHEFKIYPLAAEAIECWLNTPELEGGRPASTSPFLLPSRRSDDGQMSVSTLTRLFQNCCRTAGITTLHNLHAMRHYHAQVLYENHNDLSAISVDMGHSSEAITKAVYIQQDAKTILDGLKRPTAWDNKHREVDRLRATLQRIRPWQQPGQ